MDLRHNLGVPPADLEPLRTTVLGEDPAAGFGSAGQADGLSGANPSLARAQLGPHAASLLANASGEELSARANEATTADMTETDNGRRMVLVPLEAIQSGQVKVPGLYSIPQPAFQGVHTSQLGLGFGALPLQSSQPVISTGFGTFDAPATQPAMMNSVVMLRPNPASAGFPLVATQPSLGALNVPGQSAVPQTHMSIPGTDIQPRAPIAPNGMNGMNGMNGIRIKTEAPQATMTGANNASVGLGMPSTNIVSESRSRRESDSTISTTDSHSNQDIQNIDDDPDHKAKRNRGSYRCSKCGEPKRGHICPYRFKAKRRLDEPGPELLDSECQAELDPFMTVRSLKEWAARNGGEPNWIEAGNADLAIPIEDSEGKTHCEAR